MADSFAHVPIRPAATVVVLRDAKVDTGQGLEVLLLRRNSKLVFYGGAWVFPGGRIDAADRAVAGSDDEAARIAAAREVREEAALDLAGPLAHFAQWVTPPGRPRRFDTWYFAALAPAGRVSVDDSEVDAHRWVAPAAALEARAAGDIELPPPTFVTLETLRAHGRAEDAHRALAAMAPLRFEPRPCQVDGGTCHLYAGDAGYPSGDPTAPGPRHRLWALEDGWHYERQPGRTTPPRR